MASRFLDNVGYQQKVYGPGGIGYNPFGKAASKYGITPQYIENNDKGNVGVADSLFSMGKSLRRLEGELLALGDEKAAKGAQAAGVASNEAMKSARKLMTILENIAGSIVDFNSAYSGTYNETFSGAAGQILTETITGSWITTATVATAFNTLAGTSAYFGSFDVWVENIVAGSFDIKARNTAGAPANTYQFKWIATSG